MCIRARFCAQGDLPHKTPRAEWAGAGLKAPTLTGGSDRRASRPAPSWAGTHAGPKQFSVDREHDALLRSSNLET